MFLVLLNLALHALASHQGVTTTQGMVLVVVAATLPSSTPVAYLPEPSHPP